MRILPSVTVGGLFLLLGACTPASEHARDVAAGADARDRVTLGSVQREIHVGMTGSDVAAAHGPPNIDATDEKRSVTRV